jgi:hypothetical protein
MKVTVTVKEMNPEFDQGIADNFHDGKESADNLRYNWEDEFEVKGDITDFKVRNNATYILEGFRGEEKFSYEIPSMSIIECTDADGVVTQFAASRKLIKDTQKTPDKKGDIHFFMFLKGGQKMVSPIPGIYISKPDFPFDLPEPEEEEITTGDEE